MAGARRRRRARRARRHVVGRCRPRPRASAPTPSTTSWSATVPWQVSKVWRYEKYIEEPRLASWQAGAGRHPALVAVQTWITRRYRVSFDGVSLVQYRNERDSVGFHRDRELRWLDDTVIGVLTLGAHRPWLLRPLTGRRESYEDDDLANAVDLSPRSGDLLVMGGRTPGRLAARRPEGARPRDQPRLRAVALDVQAGPPRHQPRLLRPAQLQPLTGCRSARHAGVPDRGARPCGRRGPRSSTARCARRAARSPAPSGPARCTAGARRATPRTRRRRRTRGPASRG